jgi:hypothetical protein
MDKQVKNVDKAGRPLVYTKDSRPQYDALSSELSFPSMEDLACELQLTALGVWEPLNFRIDESLYQQDKINLSDWWRPFQPRPNIMNDRESILIYGPEHSNPWDPCGLAQMAAKLDGIKPSESNMTFPTLARQKLTCLHKIFDYFDPLGRTFIIKLNAGGHYPPHRDHILMNRPTFRLIAFLENASIDNLRWEVEDRLVHFIPNTLYYVDTRKTHRLWSSSPNSTMVIFNVIKNWSNILKLLTMLKYN